MMLPIADLTKVSDAVGQVLNDLAQPAANETGQLIADRIRFARWKSAIHIAEKAKKYAERKGVSFHEMKPKFLLEFFEGASLGEEDESLQEMWAKLLAAEGESSSPINLIFVDTLKRLGPREVECLRLFIGEDVHAANLFFSANGREFPVVDTEKLGEQWVEFSTKVASRGEHGEKLSELYDSLVSDLLPLGVIPSLLQVTGPFSDDENDVVFNTGLTKLIKSFFLLSHLKLISIQTIRWEGPGNPPATTLWFNYFQLTGLGRELLLACCPDELAPFTKHLAKKGGESGG